MRTRKQQVARFLWAIWASFTLRLTQGIAFTATTVRFSSAAQCFVLAQYLLLVILEFESLQIFSFISFVLSSFQYIQKWSCFWFFWPLLWLCWFHIARMSCQSSTYGIHPSNLLVIAVYNSFFSYPAWDQTHGSSAARGIRISVQKSNFLVKEH